MMCEVVIFTSQRVSSDNVRFSRQLTHPSLLRAAKGDIDDIETSLLSQVVAEQQLEILEEEATHQQQQLTSPHHDQETTTTKVKRKEMKREPQQQHEEVMDKVTKTSASEEIHLERRQKEDEGDNISEAKDTTKRSQELVTVELQDNSNSVLEEMTITEKQQQKEHIDKQLPTVMPTVLFKQLQQQYQSISERLKEQEDKELARRATLESRKKDAAQLREVRQSQKKLTPLPTDNVVNDDKVVNEDNKEIVIQLDQMGSYTAFNNDRHDNNATIVTHNKRQTQSIKSSAVGQDDDDEYYEHMTNGNNNTIHLASKAT